jgi:hypothetical protein
MLSLDHDVLTDETLSKLGIGNLSGGLKRLSLVAVQPNEKVSNGGWTTFVANK